ncbi:MAG TPA: PadR family transcriptional regulator, partial [Dehalococcoidia bacterium]
MLAAGSVMLARGISEFHGYDLAKQLRESERARSLVAHGTLYKALDRLRRAGLIESRWEEPEPAHAEGRPRRRLYRLTQAGSAALRAHVRQEVTAGHRL